MTNLPKCSEPEVIISKKNGLPQPWLYPGFPGDVPLEVHWHCLNMGNIGIKFQFFKGIYENCENGHF